MINRTALEERNAISASLNENLVETFDLQLIVGTTQSNVFRFKKKLISNKYFLIKHNDFLVFQSQATFMISVK